MTKANMRQQNESEKFYRANGSGTLGACNLNARICEQKPEDRKKANCQIPEYPM